MVSADSWPGRGEPRLLFTIQLNLIQHLLLAVYIEQGCTVVGQPLFFQPNNMEVLS